MLQGLYQLKQRYLRSKYSSYITDNHKYNAIMGEIILTLDYIWKIEQKSITSFLGERPQTPDSPTVTNDRRPENRDLD